MHMEINLFITNFRQDKLTEDLTWCSAARTNPELADTVTHFSWSPVPNIIYKIFPE